jgi:phosphoribosyl 1,2-cyclic phosphate phosphodiesterase
MALKVTMLGSGTSSGVPVIGCDCPVCTSTDPRDRRMRPGLKIEIGAGVVLVDTSVDLREQALRFGLPRVDAVLFTHPHADHLFGLDELRIFNYRQSATIPCYGAPETLVAVRRTFAYAFEEGQEGGGKPRIDLIAVDGPLELLGRRFLPVPVWHGSMPVLGWRVGSFAYVTDVNRIPDPSWELLEDLEVLILGALRYRPHPTHFTIEEALGVVERLRPRRAYFTHLAHEVQHARPRLALPAGVEFGFDGLVLDLD